MEGILVLTAGGMGEAPRNHLLLLMVQKSHSQTATVWMVLKPMVNHGICTISTGERRIFEASTVSLSFGIVNHKHNRLIGPLAEYMLRVPRFAVDNYHAWTRMENFLLEKQSTHVLAEIVWAIKPIETGKVLLFQQS